MKKKNIVIAWTQEGLTKTALAKFKTGIKKTFLSIDNLTDEEHITFVDHKEQVDRIAKEGSCDILLISEELGGVKIGKGSVRVWRGDNPDMRIIMVVADDKKTSGKLKGMFETLYFDALYFKDFKKSNIQALVKGSRSEADAYDYYGLADFVDPLGVGVEVNPAEEVAKRDAEKERKKKAAEEKRALKKKASSSGSLGSDDSKEEKAIEEASDEKDDNKKMAKKTAKKASDSKTGESDSAREINITLEDIAQAQIDESKALKSKKKSGITKRDEEIGNFDFDIDVERTDEELISYLKIKQHEALDFPKVMKYEPTAADVVSESLLRHYTQEDTTAIANLELHLTSRQTFTNEVNRYISEHYDVAPEIKQAAFDSFMRYMFGYDIITDVVEDPNVSDIKIYDNNNIRMKYRGKRLEAPVKFRSPEHYRAFVSHLAHRNHVSISKEDAIVHFTDTTSSDSARLRVNISTEFVNSSGFPCVHIRKVNNQKYTTAQLIEAGMFTPRIAAYLINAAQNDSGMVFTGKGSAGKTSIMNWAIDYIPRNLSGICLQESDELFSNIHPDILFQRIADDKDNNKNYDLKNLSVNALLTDIDIFIIGEIKGAESRYFINATYTGNRCWASVHSPSSRGALPKIADYAKYESDYTKNDLLEMLTTLSNVVFLKNFRVAQLSKVVGWDNIGKEVIYKDIDLDEINRRKSFPVKKAKKG